MDGRQTGERSGVLIKGFEVAYQQPFTFLPGTLSNMGMLANYTYINNSDVTRLSDAAEDNYNLSLYYETERLAIRGSYTWRGDFVSATNSYLDAELTQERQAQGILDANITYNINDNFSLVLEGINLTDTAEITRVRELNLPSRYVDTGRRILFGVRGTF